MSKFKAWFNKNLKEYKSDISQYGADTGYSGITYTSDCVKLYNRFETEIYDALNQDAEESDFDSVDAFVATFGRNDLLSSPDGRKNLLLWYMVEREASKEE